jgi:hypothetical protein
MKATSGPKAEGYQLFSEPQRYSLCCRKQSPTVAPFPPNAVQLIKQLQETLNQLERHLSVLIMVNHSSAEVPSRLFHLTVRF